MNIFMFLPMGIILTVSFIFWSFRYPKEIKIALTLKDHSRLFSAGVWFAFIVTIATITGILFN